MKYSDPKALKEKLLSVAKGIGQDPIGNVITLATIVSVCQGRTHVVDLTLQLLRPVLCPQPPVLVA